MVGELITLPLRVGVRATQLWFRATEEAVAVVADAAGRLIDRAVPRGSAAPRPHPGQARRPHPGEREPQGDVFESEAFQSASPEADFDLAAEPDLEIEVPERRSESFEPPTESEPTHVSEEPVLVEEVAEPGAENGAGAAVHVEEPWKGYGQMKADDVIARLAGATPAELAAIQLYETEGKGRVTVLEAVERELRISSGSGS